MIEASRDEQPADELKASADHPRLLLVINDAQFFLSHRLPIAVGAQRVGFEVHVAAPFDAQAWERIWEHGLEAHAIPMDRQTAAPLTEWRSFAALVRLYRALRPAIVHHVTVKPVLYGSLARRLAGGGPTVNAISGLGYIFLARGPMAAIRRHLVQTMYRIVLSSDRTAAIFQNPDDADIFIRRALIDRHRTVLIRGSGVDLQEFSFAEEISGPPRIVLPSRMLWDKGVAEFVEAARIVRQTISDARFILVGGLDINRAAIDESQLRVWEAEGAVEWWGVRVDMPEVLRLATIVCLPSYREGVPKALLEAAATGRAIVTTDVPGCREVVEDSLNGLLVPPRDGEAIAKAITTLLRDPVLRRRMGRKSRERAEREFSVDTVVRQTIELYDRLLAAHGGG